MKQNRLHWLAIILLLSSCVALLVIFSNAKTQVEPLNNKIEKQELIIEGLNSKVSRLESYLSEARSNIEKQEYPKKVTATKDYNEFVTDSLVRSIEKFDLDSFEISIRKIGKYEFDKLVAENQSNKYEHIHHMSWKEKTDENTRRVNDSIFVYNLDSGILDSLNNEDIGTMSFSAYKYAGFIDEINSYLFAGHYYEAHDCILISKTNSDKKKLKHHIVSSSQNSTLITYDWDEWVYVSGGITFYDIIDKKLIKRLEFYPPGCNSHIDNGFYWSFSDIFVIDRDYIVFTCQFQDSETSMRYQCYASLRLNEKN